MDAEIEALIRNHRELEVFLKRGLPICTESSREFRRASPTPKKACAACGLKRAYSYGPDPCLGLLPGVQNACCGHGVECGYIHFENGIVIRGVFHTDKGPGPGNTLCTQKAE